MVLASVPQGEGGGGGAHLKCVRAVRGQPAMLTARFARLRYPQPRAPWTLEVEDSPRAQVLLPECTIVRHSV